MLQDLIIAQILLKELNPNIQQTIAEEIFLLNGVNKIFQHQIDIIKRRLVIEKDGCYKIDINDLMALENLEIILFEIFSPFGFKDIRQIIRTIKSQSGKQFFSANYQLIIDRKGKRRRRIFGSNDYPPNFKLLLDSINKLAKTNIIYDGDE